MAQEELASALPQLVGERDADQAEIDRAGPRRVEPPDAGGVRLELADPLRADFLEPFDAVGEAALPEVGEPPELGLIEGDDQLPVAEPGDPVLVGEPLQGGLSLAAEDRLREPGL